jgi:hypothetical protein
LALARDATEGIGVSVSPYGATLSGCLECCTLVELKLVEHSVFKGQLHDAVRSASARGLHLRNSGASSKDCDRGNKRELVLHDTP